MIAVACADGSVRVCGSPAHEDCSGARTYHLLDVSPGNGTEDVAIGVPDSDLGGTNAGAVYWYEGPVDESTITDLSNADVVVCGTAGERCGTDVTITDTSAGAPADTANASDTGGTTNTGPADLVVETVTDTTYVMPGGEPLESVLANPPQTPLLDLLANATNSSIEVAATVTDVAREEGTQ